MNTECPWPRKANKFMLQQGVKPFVPADNPCDNAKIEDGKGTRLFWMILGYKEGADLMVEDAQKSPYVRDELIYPILFCYRHFLELSLKFLLVGRCQTLTTKQKSRHDLIWLWKKFLEVIKPYDMADPRKETPVVGDIISEFAKIDPNSCSFRYSEDQSGKLISIAYENIDLMHLTNVMHDVSDYFNNCFDHMVMLDQYKSSDLEYEDCLKLFRESGLKES